MKPYSGRVSALVGARAHLPRGEGGAVEARGYAHAASLEARRGRHHSGGISSLKAALRFGLFYVALGSLACGTGEEPPPPEEVCARTAELPPQVKPPKYLSLTGLYESNNKLASYVEGFEPRYKLWSDGAEKQRYAFLPGCEPIDTRDMDHWQVPIGSRFWKEFTVDGVRIETRLIHRFGAKPEDWFFAAYLWNEDQTDAVLVPDGYRNAKGTQHDVPGERDCRLCHEPQSERLLGFSALQLSSSEKGVTTEQLSRQKRLTFPLEGGFEVPGTGAAKAALGYLHANCGGCHNRTFQEVNLRLRLHVTEQQVEDTDAFTTTIGEEPVSYPCTGCQLIYPGDSSQSVLFHRITTREQGLAMPPIATKVIDQEGVEVVKQWIDSLGPAAQQ